MIKNYLKSYLYLLLISIVLTFILSLIAYFIKLNNNLIILLTPSISTLISCIILGKKCKQKAYLEGLKFSSLYLLLISIIKLLLHSSFNYKVIITYLIIILSSIIGSMIGINLKKE